MFGKIALSCYKGTADYDLMNVVFVNNYCYCYIQAS